MKNTIYLLICRVVEEEVVLQVYTNREAAEREMKSRGYECVRRGYWHDPEDRDALYLIREMEVRD